MKTHTLEDSTRRRMGSQAVALVAAVLLCAGTEGTPAAEVKIGTGSTAGLYYQVSRALCRLVNRDTERHGVNCQALATDGSIFNLNALRSGELQFAMSQSDWQFHSMNGTGPFADAGPDPDLRALFSVHGEPFTVVARTDSGIENLDGLKGARVNLGNPGSGQRATMEVVMKAKGWTVSDFLLAEELSASEQSLALCHDRVEAMVYTVGHPNPSVTKAVGLCNAVLVDVSGAEIDRLVGENAYYAYTTIPGGMYHNNPDPITTFGVTATVVSAASVDADTVYIVVKALFEALDEFRGMHPAWGGLTPESMITDGLSAPLHEGAARYYSEAGLN